MEEIIKEYFRLVNADKFDELFDTLFAPDVEFHAPFDYHAKGLENVKPFYLMVPSNYPEHVDTPVHIHVSGNRAAVYIEFEGKTAGGIPITFQGTDWFVIENGKIKFLHIFFDIQRIANILEEGRQ